MFQVFLLGQKGKKAVLFDFAVLTEAVNVYGCAVNKERGQDRGQVSVKGDFSGKINR